MLVPIEATAPSRKFDLSGSGGNQCHRRKNQINHMNNLIIQAKERAAAGPAFLVWICGGGLGAAILVFVVLKLAGH
jgi:hypothetical protein